RIGPCPNCGGTDRFSINTVKGLFNCRGCNTVGDVIDLVIFLDHCGFEEACETLTHEPKPNGHDGNGNVHRITREIAWFPYEDENEELSFQVVKYEPKDFRQRRPDGKGGWTWSTKGLRPIPYRLPQLIEALAHQRVVFIVEGEKDVETLR